MLKVLLDSSRSKGSRATGCQSWRSKEISVARPSSNLLCLHFIELLGIRIEGLNSFLLRIQLLSKSILMGCGRIVYSLYGGWICLSGLKMRNIVKFEKEQVLKLIEFEKFLEIIIFIFLHPILPS